MRPFSETLRPFQRVGRHLRNMGGTTLFSVVFLIGCAAGPDDQTDGSVIPDGYPTIASVDFNGRFDVTEMMIDGGLVDLDGPSVRLMEFDVVTGAATVEVSCDRRLGSFTFAADQRASITLTGGQVVEPCPPSGVDDVLWDLVERIERWESADDGFRLIAADGDHVVLTRV